METAIGIVIVLLLLLLFLGLWKVMSAPSMMRRGMRMHGMMTPAAAPAIQVAVTPTTPAVAVAQPSGTPSASTVNTSTTATPVTATAASPPAAAAAATQEYMSRNKWTPAWNGFIK